MKCHIKTLRPMRTAIQLLSFSTLLLCANEMDAQTGFQVVTGPTSFTGASNLEDGIQISSTGSYSTQLAMYTDILPFCSADAEMNWGSLGLTASERRHEISEWYGFGAGLRLHQPYENQRIIQPWLGVGISFMQQANYADLADASGQSYHYWSDGRVYDMPENDVNAAVLAQEVAPDYAFESQTRTQNSLAVPVRLGVNLNLTPRFYASAAFSMLVGAEASLDPRPGYTDYLTTAQAGLGIRIGRDFAEPRIDYPEAWAELGDDFDQDGIKDNRDRCPGTPEGIAIDRRGCPVDSDKDGVADYQDDEPFSPHARVNLQGVSLSNAQWQALEAEAAAFQPRAHEEFQRIETKTQAPQVTSVDTRGNTPAESRLLQTFGSIKSTIQVKAKSEQPVGETNAIKSGNNELLSIDELKSYRAVMPAIRPAYRVQLTPDVRMLDMELITPFILSGEVTQKFDQSSTMTFVTQAVYDAAAAQADLTKMKNAGFVQAFIVGEFNGRIIDVATAEQLDRELHTKGTASK